MPSTVGNTAEPSLTALVFDALGSPDTFTDHDALLAQADDFLREAKGGDADLLHAARNMAGRAFEFGLYRTLDEWEELRASARALSMMFELFNCRNQKS